MPCYNAENTIDEALSSLALQTLEDFEVVLVDDGSTDATLQIVQAWGERDQRLRAFSCRHRGIVQTLNHGLGLCRAAVIARMDTDDRCHPERLALQLDYLNKHPEISVVSCLVRGFPQYQVREGFQIYMDWLNSLLFDQDIRREMFIESPLPHPSVMFRKQQVNQAGAYLDNGWAEDYDLWLRMYLLGCHFGKVPRVLLEWREHPRRLTRSDSRYSLENFLRAKANYLAAGPLSGRDTVYIWGAGMIGRRLSKHLVRCGINLGAFIDIDPLKIGSTLRGLPIVSPEAFQDLWGQNSRPALIAAVGSRGARHNIREYLTAIRLVEGFNWWAAA